MKRFGKIPLTTLALVVVIGSEAGGQVTTAKTEGFHFGAALSGVSVMPDKDDFGDDVESENGGGISLYAAYNFLPNFGVFLGIGGASIQSDGGGSYALGHGDLGVRVSLGTGAAVPYLEAAFSGINAAGDVDGDDIEFQGKGFTGGLGLNFFVTQKLALDIGLKYTKGELNTFKVNGQSATVDDGLGISTARLNVGIAYYPSSGGGLFRSR